MFGAASTLQRVMLDSALRREFNTEWVLLGRPTCDVIRVTVSGGNPAANIEGTETPVANLAGLKCTYKEMPIEMVSRSNGLYEMGDYMFRLYVSTRLFPAGLEFDDVVVFDGKTWDIKGLKQRRVAQNGRAEVIARVSGDS